jgi:hypothetical protein
MYAICAAEIDTAPPDADGHMNFPRSSRFYSASYCISFS